MTKRLICIFTMLLALAHQGMAQQLRPSNHLNGLRSASQQAQTGDAEPKSADFIVAVVNSEPITNNEVRARVLRTEQQMTQHNVPLPPRAELANQVLQTLINEKAQIQLARETGIKIDSVSLDAAADSVARQNQMDLPEFRKALEASGMSYAQFRADLTNEMLLNRIRERDVDSRLRISDADVDTYIREQQNVTDDATLNINLAQILFAVPDGATPEEVASIKTKAESVLALARRGDDFAKLAQEYSNAPGAAKGGEMGLRSASRYPDLFVDATKNLRPGGISALVRSGAGFHILKVLAMDQGGLPAAVVQQTHARHILLRVSPQLSESDARARLVDIRNRILSGAANFTDMAKEYSQDGSAKDGGDLGWANPGAFVPEFEGPMNALAPGQISDPVVSRFGVHLIQVLERRQKTLSQSEQRDIARAVLKDKKQEEAYQNWAKEVRGNAYVEMREAPQI